MHALGITMLVKIIIQLAVLFGGIFIANIARLYRQSEARWLGAFIGLCAGVWFAWEFVDRYFVIMNPFAEKWLGLIQVLLCLVIGLLMFFFVLLQSKPNRARALFDEESVQLPTPPASPQPTPSAPQQQPGDQQVVFAPNQEPPPSQAQ